MDKVVKGELFFIQYSGWMIDYPSVKEQNLKVYCSIASDRVVDQTGK